MSPGPSNSGMKGALIFWSNMSARFSLLENINDTLFFQKAGGRGRKKVLDLSRYRSKKNCHWRRSEHTRKLGSHLKKLCSTISLTPFLKLPTRLVGSVTSNILISSLQSFVSLHENRTFASSAWWVNHSDTKQRGGISRFWRTIDQEKGEATHSGCRWWLTIVRW